MSKKQYSRRERFYSFLISALCICAVVLVAALVIQSKLGARRDAPVQAAMGTSAATAAPLTLKTQESPAPTDPGAESTAPSSTPAPQTAEPSFEFLPVISRAETEEKVIAITVDDCSHQDYVKYAALAAQHYGAKLTLFPFGKSVMKDGMPEILRVCVFDMGFEVENRTWSDALIYRLPESELCSEIWSADMAVDYALDKNYDMRFFRMRGGSGARDARTHAYLKQLGYEAVVTWTVSGSDIDEAKLRASIAPGNIYRFSSSEEDVKKMIGFMAFASEKGYQMVTLSELLGYGANVCEDAGENLLAQTMPLLENYQPVYVQHQIGDRAWQVLLIQSRLGELGYLAPDGADGVFGESTSSAISKFQATCGLMGTGVATAETQTRLFADDAPRNPDPAPTVALLATPTPSPAA